MRTEFEKELESLINRYSLENRSDTPDFILAEYLVNCLNAFDIASRSREAWYGVNVNIMKSHTIKKVLGDKTNE